MGLSDYDKIINIIENNLSESWYEVEKILVAETGDNIRVLTDFRRRIAGDGLTLEQYFKNRRIIRILEVAIETGNPIIDVAANYGCYDPSTIHKQARKIFGKSPGEIVESGDLEGKNSLVLLEDIIDKKYNGEDEIDEKVALSVEKYKDLIKEQIDTITELRNELSLARKKDFEPITQPDDELYEDIYVNLNEAFFNQIHRLDMLRDDAYSYKYKGKKYSDKILIAKIEKEVRERKRKAADDAWKELYFFYLMFSEMENLKEIYGLSQSDIMNLNIKSHITGESLNKLCYEHIEALEYASYEETDDDFDPISYMEDFYREFYTDEFTDQEAYDYYFGDDEFEFEDHREYND